MAAPGTLSIDEQIKQLDDARRLVLSDPSYYPRIIQGILPIINPEAIVELKRWVAQFLAEGFASPQLPAQQKEALALIVLDTLKALLENVQEDVVVLQSVVQTAASIYPLVLKWIISNPYDGPTWERMLAIKSRILRIWDTAATGVRICCIKFAQQIVLAQTTGPEPEPRRDGYVDMSLALVPENHPLIPPRNLEAEASGLLDRVLGIFQESAINTVLINATLNSLSVLVRARPRTANKILNVILNFNPLKLANSPMTPKLRVMVKSMEKTTRSLLIHINKRDPQNPLSGRIQQYVERMMRSRTEIFDETNKKRGHPEYIDGGDVAKRAKLGEHGINANRLQVPPLTPGPHTVGELFTITTDDALKTFDVALLSEDLVVKIGVTILQRLDSNTLNQAIEGVRHRYKTLESSRPGDVGYTATSLGVDDDDDDYEPDFYNAEDTEQILNKLDTEQPEESNIPGHDMALGTFTLPPPPPLTPEQAANIGQGTISRVFSVMQTLEEPGKKPKAGMNRLAASTYDRDAWITIITRLATRAIGGLEDAPAVKEEPGASSALSLANHIRESLYIYVLEDFRKRIDIAVAWLCEEWYNDKIQAKSSEHPILNYEKWALKVLNGIVPYLDARDKVLTRFLSEIPALSSELLEKVKGLCRDPSMVNLSLTSLLYLVMMRPPVRELALDAVEDVWATYEDAKPIAAKYLTKWRPGFAERIKPAEDEETKSNGAASL